MANGNRKVKGLQLHIKGVVQGVGFRPFIYRLATKNNLFGSVLNNSEGVFIRIFGSKENMEQFQRDIFNYLPPAAKIVNIHKEEIMDIQPQDFKIIKSEKTTDKSVFISPDIALCNECKKELEDKNNFRYHYPFINCTNCGPRYTIIKDVPYDRPLTSMKDFAMCSTCQKEYEDPLDRRFHAQPNACGSCGPVYTLDNEKANSIDRAKKLLKEGYILAIKGIGGFHLACDGFNEEVVNTLRQRKKREDKPFAIMVKNLDMAHKIAHITKKDEEYLLSPASPIVLLRKKTFPLAKSIAPNNPYIGIMLSYAPIHHLLLEDETVLVMTSANSSGEPIIFENEVAKEKLTGIADFILYHNRDIVNPVDDSVVSSSGDGYIIRRGRGYAPVPIEINQDNKKQILSLGGELKSTFGILKNDFAFLSPHIGDLENQKTYDLYKNTLDLYKRIFNFTPEIVACDLHPEYFSTKFAKSLNLPIMYIQHHHSHIASVMAEHNLKGKVLGIALDGTGFGDDGNLWGGEFLICDLENYTRVGHFKEEVLPSSAKAILEPWRMAAYKIATLYDDYKSVLDRCKLNYPLVDLLIDSTKKGLNAPITTSSGRVFDMVSAILNICHKITYEGQAAIMLEMFAQRGEGEIMPYKIEKVKGQYILNFDEMYRDIINLKQEKSKEDLAHSFHLTLAEAITKLADTICKEFALDTICLSGGVCQNNLLMNILKNKLHKYTVYTNKKIPPNDGGISYGQLAIASYRLNKEK